MPHFPAGQYDVEIDARDNNRRVINVRNESGDIVEPFDREWFINQGRPEMLFQLPDDLSATEEEIDAIMNYARNPPPPPPTPNASNPKMA